MKCMRCGGAVDQTIGVHRYDESGVDGVFLVNVPIRRCRDCGATGVVIPRIEQLHRTLAAVIATKPERLLPAEARFLRTCLGLSKADLARDLGEPAEAVAAWESKAHPSVMRLETEMRLRLMAVYLAPVQHYGPERLGAVARQEPRQTEIRIVPSKRGWQPAPATA